MFEGEDAERYSALAQSRAPNTRSDVREADPPYWSSLRGIATVVRVEEARGWPFRALYCYWVNTEPSEVPSMVGAFGSNPMSGPIVASAPFQVYPFLPLWRGVVANLMLYGAALFAAHRTPLIFRAWTRRRRNLCVTCGHVLIQSQARCPECGASRTGP